MKVKWKYAKGPAVIDYSAEIEDVGEVLEILKDPDVISISVKKRTPAEHFKAFLAERKIE